MERKEAIRSAYHMTGSNSFYDGMMTCSTLPGRAVCRLVWDMNRQDCVRYQEKAVSGIPEDFAGRLLEVPVGTGILTMPLYRTLPRAEITCLDYSPDMMAQDVYKRQNDISAMSRLHRSASGQMTRQAISIRSDGGWTFGSPSVLMMFYLSLIHIS